MTINVFLVPYPERITKADKNMVNDPDYEGIKFPISKKHFSQIEQKNNICINVFCYENQLTYPVYASDQKFENCMDLLLITDKNKSHYVYIKDFNRFMCQNVRLKNNFSSIVYNFLVVKKSCKIIKKIA